MPPSTYAQEKHKVEHRLPAAVRFIAENRLNERFEGDLDDIGIVVQGGLTNSVLRALERLGLANEFGESRVPLYVMNVAYPVVPAEIQDFAVAKKALLVVEEGTPDYLEQAVHVALRRADLQTRVIGKEVLIEAGEYTAEVMLRGVQRFLDEVAPEGVDTASAADQVGALDALKARAGELLGAPVPVRPPSFCTGCPERPVFSALKVLEKEFGPTHVAADVGCHTMATLPPFNLGNTMLGYGLGLSSASAVAPSFAKRVVSIMGDGGFWHNGITSGVASSHFNKDDSILIIMKNGYASATGWQYLPSSQQDRTGAATGMSIEAVLKGLGVPWIRRVRTYNVANMIKTLRRAMTSGVSGLKVIVADGECQLARQRRLRPQIRKWLQAGRRVVRTRFGIDDDICTGDHACIRLSGCPSLTIKPNPDPLRDHPVAHVDNGCLGCGLCGEVAHAAVLCPSFYRAQIIQNPTAWDRWIDRRRQAVIGWLRERAAA
jgi:indolepyruvate ferredoxin oxidoreductase alpha subunit